MILEYLLVLLKTQQINGGELIGKTADMIVVIVVGNRKYYNLQPDNLTLWDGNFEKLVKLQTITLQANQAINILTGKLNVEGKDLNIYLGMKINGKIIYFPKPIVLKIG